ncbi:hypothetical protein CEXT_522181 [Caerostris extrusa]|uniref:Uncharacterized protein n=1 Tax=Caerostris extrusa TaxID=172846 RepID=A0AAV4S3S5_CAEEX|nr:hypothetical protein CEXT_522181 [Caerostris extrusa]
MSKNSGVVWRKERVRENKSQSQASVPRGTNSSTDKKEKSCRAPSRRRSGRNPWQKSEQAGNFFPGWPKCGLEVLSRASEIVCVNFQERVLHLQWCVFPKEAAECVVK